MTSASAARVAGGIKPLLVLHHVWKCGGSNFCTMAIKNGETVPSADDQPANRCDLYINPEVLKAFPRSTHYSFAEYQHALPVDAPLGNSKVAFLTILRDPLNQALSWFRHVEIRTSRYNSLEDFLDFGEGWKKWRTETFNNGQPPPKYNHCVAHSFECFQDNLQIRWLLGDKEFEHGKPLRLSHSWLKRAKDRLDRFDEVFVLEDFHDRDAYRMAKYGWHDLDDGLSSGNTTGSQFHSNARQFLKSMPRLLAKLKELQKWDVILYQYGSELAAKQATASAIQPRLLQTRRRSRIHQQDLWRFGTMRREQ
jgi:hypothetical protein